MKTSVVATNNFALAFYLFTRGAQKRINMLRIREHSSPSIHALQHEGSQGRN